jgi:hypothetical protein
MATSPTEVTHGFTLSAPHWAWLILNGHKIIENRQVRFAPGWYAVHVGLTAYTSVIEELKYHKELGMPSMMGSKNGHVYGLCKIETGVPYDKCKKNRWAIGDFNICNIITEIIPFDGGETTKARGNFGTWPLKESEKRVRELTKQAIQLGHRKKTNAKEVLGDVLDAVVQEAPVVKAKRPAEEAPKAQGKAGSAVKKTKREEGSSTQHAKAAEPLSAAGASATDKPDIRSFFVKK